jgi:hypothetical protein
VVTKKSEEHFNSQDSENVLYYEMLDFIVEFSSGDPSKTNASLEDSLKCARLMDRARKDAGIVFAVDKIDKNR